MGCAAAALCAGAEPALAQLAPNTPGDRLGAAAVFGDFDGDSLTDFAVSAPGARVAPGMIMIRVPPGGEIIIRVPPFAGMEPSADADGPTQSGSVLIFMNSQTGFAAPRTLDQSMLAAGEDGDEFGAALVAGDFNGDGRDDLAVGAPGKKSQAGAVFLYQGSPLGLMPLRALDASTGDLGEGAAGDRFGASLAIGRLDGDARIDLAVGAPGVPTPDGLSEAGAVYVYGGRPSSSSGDAALLEASQRLDQAQETTEVPELRDRFGFSLAALDLDGDARDELAVGSPGEALGSEPRGSGAVFVYRSTGNAGLKLLQQFDQESMPLLPLLTPFNNQPGDSFGTALSAGDFDGDRLSDLAVGAPNVGQDVGLVQVFRGSPNGLKLGSAMNGIGVPDARYGSSLAAGDFNGDGLADLGVGAPGRTGGAGVAIGTVFVLVSNGPGAPMALEQRAFVADTRDATRGELGSAIRAGDLDGDGLADLAVGAPGAARGGTPAGRLLLLRGNVTPAALGEPRELVQLDGPPLTAPQP